MIKIVKGWLRTALLVFGLASFDCCTMGEEAALGGGGGGGGNVVWYRTFRFGQG